ncbi:MAG: hypothetical protein JKX98_06405 [Alcanivoracaceae bacterium]|nr:hypothetical protein [Alcanivoracaceae bacterium]
MEVDDWIGGNIHKPIPETNDKIKFAKIFMDNFESWVLQPLAAEFNKLFRVIYQA